MLLGELHVTTISGYRLLLSRGGSPLMISLGSLPPALEGFLHRTLRTLSMASQPSGALSAEFFRQRQSSRRVSRFLGPGVQNSFGEIVRLSRGAVLPVPGRVRPTLTPPLTLRYALSSNVEVATLWEQFQLFSKKQGWIQLSRARSGFNHQLPPGQVFHLHLGLPTLPTQAEAGPLVENSYRLTFHESFPQRMVRQ